MKLFADLLHPTDQSRILDVGGTEYNWQFLDTRPEVTLLNIDIQKNEKKGRFTYIKGDGRKIPYLNKTFDIVYSNSVIEHVGTLEDQRIFAAEVARVGKSYFVQTPNKDFFFEPHLLTPFIHFLPRSSQLRLARRFTLWGLITKPSPLMVRDMIENTNLLNEDELRTLFPNAKLVSERFLGFSKSLLAYSVSD